MIKIVCVLKSGGDYDIEYVRRLVDGIKANITVPYYMYCLTDLPHDERWDGLCEPHSLDHDLPGWWSKMEMFRLTAPVLYFDLDTVIVGNIDPLCKWVSNECEGLMMLRGFYRQDRCSGIMGWRHDMKALHSRFFERFAPNAEYIKRPLGVAMRARGRQYRGDQEWLSPQTQQLNIPTPFVQDIFPSVYSYKVHVQDKGLPDDAAVICFHGKPRPHEVEALV